MFIERSCLIGRDQGDRVEDYVCQAIRYHKVPLTAAQHAMASNWTSAVATLALPPIPAGYDG